MEKNNFNYQEEVLKAGLLVGFASVFIVLITYIINFEISLEWWYGLLTLSVTIGLVIYLGINFRTNIGGYMSYNCLLYTSPSPRDLSTARMPSSA